jgi:zinc transport system substrate-binding protein
MILSMLFALAAAGSADAPLRIGVTLHPYFSWTSAIVEGTDVVVVPIVPGDVDAGDYVPRAEDIATVATLDAIVENALGHDAFVEKMITASANTNIVRLRINSETPTIGPKGNVNSHTFLSIVNAIQQTQWLSRKLQALRPAHAAAFAKNAAGYVAELRRVLEEARAKLGSATGKRVITVHDGYAYLLRDLGITLVGVVEPAHGVVPSAREFAALVALVKDANVRVVLAEATIDERLRKALNAMSCRAVVVSHIASGPYTKDRFINEMRENTAIIAEALSK